MTIDRSVGRLVDAWDILVERRRRRSARVPALAFTGPEAAEMSRKLAARLVRVSKTGIATSCIPHAALETAPDPHAALAALANRLEKSMPRGSGRLDLTLYKTARCLVGVTLTSDFTEIRERQLFEELYQRQVGVDRAVRVLKTLAKGPGEGLLVGPWQAVVEPAVTPLAKAAFSWRLRRGRRYRALAAEIARELQATHRGFLDAAELLATEQEQGRHDFVLLILAWCLVQDLDHAVRRSFLSIRRRRRTTPFVLLFHRVAAESPTDQLLQVLTHVVRDERSGSVIVAASLLDESPADVMPLDKAAETLAAWTDPVFPHVSSDSVVNIEVPAGAFDGWRDRPPARPHPAFLGPVVPVVCWIGLVALAAGSVDVLGDSVADIRDPCPGISRRDGELIGLGDGTADCRFFAEGDGAEMAALRKVEKEIADENQRVRDDAGQERDYRTIVYFGPLTWPGGPERKSQSGLRSLRAVAIAQRHVNQDAGRNVGEVPIVVKLANPGDRFSQGEDVARQITRAARHDDTLVGVVGVSQSREVTRRSIEILEEEQLPVIGGTPSADSMVTTSKDYYQMAPPNRREAQMMVAFAVEHPAVAAKRALIVTDDADLYSLNLAADLRQEFEDAGRRVVAVYANRVEGEPLPTDLQLEVREGLSEVANGICDQYMLGDVVFFASRSQQFGGLLDDLQEHTGCIEPIVLIGGDDVAKVPQDHDIEATQFPSIDVYYAAFGSATTGTQNVRALKLQGDYRQRYGSDDLALDMSDPAVNYDAVFAMSVAINRSNDRERSRTSVAQVLSDGIAFEGASGYIEVSGASDSQRSSPDKPVLIVHWAPGPQAPLLRCGRFTEQEDVRRWGPDDAFACPR